jgi:signal transduction histidine kinase
MPVDYAAYPVLFVDDEQQNLVAFRYAFDERFAVLTASSGQEAVGILQRQDVAVLLTDQRMPGMTGVELCEKARELRPYEVRVLVTAYADLHAAIDAINQGQVLRYLTKPWNNEELAEVIRTCIDLVSLQRVVHEMEMRLLQGGQTTTAVAIHQELAHEINNPLLALNMNTEHIGDLIGSALKLVGESDRLRQLLAEAQEATSDALAATHQIAALIAKLRSGYKPGAAPVTATCDAARVVDSTVRIVRREVERVARLQVVLEASPIAPIDSAALGQVMLNLLLNATQALEGCERPLAERRITVRLSEEPHAVKISVADNGPGIAEEHIQRVFDPYFTTKKGNTGIGLAVASDLCKRAGGAIEVESKPGEGAAFTVTFPRVAGNGR